MNLLARVKQLIADHHATGYASQLPESVTSILEHIAETVDNLGGVDVAKIEDTLKASVEAKVEHFLNELSTVVLGRVADLEKVVAELKAPTSLPAPDQLPADGVVVTESDHLKGAGDVPAAAAAPGQEAAAVQGEAQPAPAAQPAN